MQMLAAIDSADTQEITKLQGTIDRYVYDLYNLTPEETECVSRKGRG